MGMIITTLYWLLALPIIISFSCITICLIMGLFSNSFANSSSGMNDNGKRIVCKELLGIKLW